MRLALLTALLLSFALPAAAHPHAYVVQQALLSLGRSEAVLTYRIAPSTQDGAHMFDHLDANRDGALSAAEERAFVTDLLAATALTIDGARVAPRQTSAAFPDRTTMSAGAGVIEIATRASLALDRAHAHDIALVVRYDRFAPDWFLQPYYFADLTDAGTPQLERRAGSPTIRIVIGAD